MQNRRKFLTQSSLFTGAFALLKPFEGISKALKYVGAGSGYQSLSILHTSDLHLINGNDFNAAFKNLKIIQQRIESLRSNCNNIVLLHNGNFVSTISTLENNISNQYIAALQGIGYDAITLGKIDITNNRLFSNEKNDPFSITIIDTIDSLDINSTKKLPYQIVKKGMLNIGIIANPISSGIINKSVETKAAILSKTALFLKETQQCNLVICMSTGNSSNTNSKPINNDIAMAALTTHIDVIISGNNLVERPLNQVCSNAKKEEVFIHTSSFDGAAVGRIDVSFDDAFYKRSIKGFYRESGYFVNV